jgi:hypothetical protein
MSCVGRLIGGIFNVVLPLYVHDLKVAHELLIMIIPPGGCHTGF